MSNLRTLRAGAGAVLALSTIGTGATLALAGAASSAAASPASAHSSWFHDPVSAAARRSEIAVPTHPSSYVGRLRQTTATFRTHDGSLAVRISSARGHLLVKGEAVSLTKNGLFRFNSAILTRTARGQIGQLNSSLSHVSSVSCEGYTDFGGVASHEHALSLARARAVCALIHQHRHGVSTTSVGYGGNRPVIVGGTTTNRAQNRRVDVVVTSSTPLTTSPTAPRLSSAVAGDTTAAITFAAPTHNGGAKVTSYQVSTDGGHTWTGVSETGNSPYSVTLHGLTDGTTYPVTVRAINSAGHSVASNSRNVTPKASATVPNAPVITNGTSGQNGMSEEISNLTFTAPTSDGGAAITGYLVSQDGGPYTALTYTAGSPNTAAVDTGDRYCAPPSFSYTIEATNSIGTSPASNTFTVNFDDGC
jgi:outer membrane protein OmpA-like peptidoglycan-associated protein